ncbi:hypothetical protein HYDPIDRAFT_165948 [Hydnomerulius pinastri MD-312]|nr:hypothetical protein HYDPIDRAFT_165948 [Hydnomerulius pinastri MD-312]
MANPYELEVPDHASNNFADAQAMFTALGKTEQEAAQMLADLWQLNNTKARIETTQKEEEELARQEEHKKYKNKYTPIPRVPLSSNPIFTACCYAEAKMKQGRYCPLFFYTNKGHRVSLTLPAIDDGTLSIIRSDSGEMVFQSTAEAKAKECAILDEDLSWEEFSEANIRMLNDMAHHSWDPERTLMVQTFWLDIEGHRWRHSVNEFNKQALLIYQGHVRRQWHACIDTPAAFSLIPLDDDTIREYHDKLVNGLKSVELTKRRQDLPPIFSVSLPTFHPIQLTIQYQSQLANLTQPLSNPMSHQRSFSSAKCPASPLLHPSSRSKFK